MKIIISLFIGLFLFTLASANLFAQDKKITIILLRHAEKDILDEENNPGDPNLSAEGLARAKRLVKILKKYRPYQIYSTNFRRARLTITPLAEETYSQYRLPIQIYDGKRLEDFANQLLASKARTIVVVGHSNTIPALANLLIKQDKYKTLAESEYDKMWIIKIKKGKAKDKIILY